MYGVEKLRRAGRLDGKLHKAGQEGRESGNAPALPAGSQHIFLTETEDKEHACHGDDPVNRRHGCVPDVCLYG